MWLWILLFIAMAIFSIVGVFYMAFHMARFSFLAELAEKHKLVFRVVSVVSFVIILIGLGVWLNAFNAALIFLHLLTFWILADLIARVVRRNKQASRRYYAGAFAICFTVIYLAVGAYMDYHVWEENYDINSDKQVGNIRLAMIADSHMGTTFGGEGFAKRMEQIKKSKPDMLVIAGDFVDDDSSREDMIASCQTLGQMDLKYGVFFVFGNHDKGYYNGRGFTGGDLYDELTNNGVHVLEDEAVLIDDRFYLIGRQDASEEYVGSGRAAMSEIVENLDKSKFMIVADHQPNSYDEEALSGVDLVLSGHTHGGQLFPVNLIEKMTGIDDQTYGIERRRNTDFIVTSGISDWTIKFKTCCKSEYVIVDVKGADSF